MNGLTEIMEKVKQFALESVIEPIKAMTVVDYIDVFMLTVVIFMLIRFVSNRRAGKLATGIFLIVAAYVLVNAVDMRAMKFLLSSFYQVGFIAIIIIFQDDLRAALEKVGGISTKIVKTIGDTTSDEKTEMFNTETKDFIKEVTDAVIEMSKERTGALIVIEGSTKIGDYTQEATIIDANVSSKLLQNIFFNRSPLHDGAVIIKDMRVFAAGCKLPLTKRELDFNAGTRHRAALGISDTASDAIVIVVSEETGTVSVCYNGEIRRGFDKDKLAKDLRKKLQRDKKKRRFLASQPGERQNRKAETTSDDKGEE